jgi:hypothetical protein
MKKHKNLNSQLLDHTLLQKHYRLRQTFNYIYRLEAKFFYEIISDVKNATSINISKFTTLFPKVKAEAMTHQTWSLYAKDVTLKNTGSNMERTEERDTQKEIKERNSNDISTSIKMQFARQ